MTAAMIPKSNGALTRIRRQPSFGSPDSPTLSSSATSPLCSWTCGRAKHSRTTLNGHGWIDQSSPWRSVQRDGDSGHDVRIVTTRCHQNRADALGTIAASRRARRYGGSRRQQVAVVGIDELELGSPARVVAGQRRRRPRATVARAVDDEVHEVVRGDSERRRVGTRGDGPEVVGIEHEHAAADLRCRAHSMNPAQALRES
jgi:hypothetical protein